VEKDTDTPVEPQALGARLQEARKARRLTQQQAADSLGIARTTLVAIEKGERRVQDGELVRMAGLYGRQVNELLRRQLVTESFAVQFRAARSSSAAADDEQERQVAELQLLCEDYIELEQLCSSSLPRSYPAEYRVDTDRPEQAAEEVASAERNRLGLGDGPVLRLRELLENDVGLRIFFMDMPSRIAGMFGYTSELGGCIAINAKHPDERRRWSLAHEYAHFLAGRFRPDVTIFIRYERVPARERFADAFTRCFLMPAAGLGRRLGALRREGSAEVTIADILTLADLYRVSFEALIHRLEELRLIAGGTWDRLSASGFKVRAAQAVLGLHPGAGDRGPELLPARYRYLAVQAFEDDLLTEGQLARLLRTDRLGARVAAERLKRRPDVAEAGDVGELSIDFSAPVRLS